MSSDQRYELLEKIGSGSFATVYRARDRELGREVAIKQIHQEYLEKPEQLERYWQEAQLVASLHHPNIVTFFDIDREKGWLIMELMQANLADRMAGRQMDLKALRTTIAHGLRVLKYLHSRGIVHGDIKPSNMMIDERRRIKLGDFGLARRVSDEDGSLLKGTTKYMAPEVVSDEFGEVGPASDLYSLGFTAYDLMCGPNFEDLFPGMSAYGRNKQAAWMMWHAAPDRRLPKIENVLQGVPEDLANVVDKLVEKDQSNRYQSADEALSDLNIDIKIIKTGGDTDDASDSAAGANKQRKIAIAAFAFSVVLTLVILFMPSGDSKPTGTNGDNKVIDGVVGKVVIEDELLVIDVVEGKEVVPKPIKFNDKTRVRLNEKEFILPRDLQPDDQVRITWVTGENGKTRMEIHATRPDIATGTIANLQHDNEQFNLSFNDDRGHHELVITIAATTQITLNGRKAKLTELKDNDRATVHHIADQELSGARMATVIVAFQDQKVSGFLRQVDATKQELTIEVAKGDGKELVVLSLAQNCNVTVNGKQVMNGALLIPANLKPGDHVTVSHHTEAFEIRAIRKFRFTGVVQELNDGTRSLVVADDKNERSVFVLGEDCAIAIQGQAATFADVRRNDRVDVTFDRNQRGNVLSTLDASRPVNKNRIAIVIGIQNYDDDTLTKLPFGAADARLVHKTLLERYAVSPDQILLLVDETRVRIEQSIPDWLKRANENSEVIVYFCGHAYVDEDNQAFLAARDFSLQRTSESGLPLTWLREVLEACPADDKMLLLDCCHDGEGDDLQKEPAAAVVLEALQPSADPAVFRSTAAIASSRSGQRGLVWAEKQHGLFAYCVAEGFSGLADKNRDVDINPTEMFEFLKSSMATLTVDDKTQAPQLFLPDDSPPAKARLSDPAMLAIRNLIGNHWERSRFTSSIDKDFRAAEELAAGEQDARLAYALMLMRTLKRRDAIGHLNRVNLNRPNLLLPYEAIAWIHFRDENYSDGSKSLATLLSIIAAKVEEAGNLDANDQRLLTLIGSLREFATTVANSERQPSKSAITKLDDQIQKTGDEAGKLYQKGRDEVATVASELDEQIKSEKSANKKKLLLIARERLEKYVPFDYAAARQSILDGLLH